MRGTIYTSGLYFSPLTLCFRDKITSCPYTTKDENIFLMLDYVVKLANNLERVHKWHEVLKF